MKTSSKEVIRFIAKDEKAPLQQVEHPVFLKWTIKVNHERE